MAKLDGPCFYRVDAHNVVPVWETSDQQEHTPRDIRKKIMCKLGQFLTEFPPVVKHPVDTAYPCKVRYFLHLKHNWVLSIWFLWIKSFKKPGTLVFCYQNCSDLLWEKIVLVIEAKGQEFAKCLRSLEQCIQTVKGQNNFENRMLFSCACMLPCCRVAISGLLP